MKIIKVIHPSNQDNTENEKEYLSFVNHAIDKFLSETAQQKILADIVWSKYELRSDTPGVKGSIIGSAIGAVGLTTTLGVGAIGSLFTKQGSSTVSPLVDEKNNLKIFVKQILINFLKNKDNNLNKVEFISLEEAKQKYSRTTNLAIGTYTIHPRDSLRLTRLEYFHKNLAMEKDDELIVLLGRMGAKSLDRKSVV